MAKERKITKSIGFTLNLLDELEWLIDSKNPNRQWVSLTDAVDKLVSIGLFVVRTTGKVDSTDLIKQMDGMIKDEKTMEWIQSLSPTQRIGLKQMIEMEEERKQTHF